MTKWALLVCASLIGAYGAWGVRHAPLLRLRYAEPILALEGKPVEYAREARREVHRRPVGSTLHVRDFAGRERTMEVTARRFRSYFSWALVLVFVLAPAGVGLMAFRSRRPHAEVLLVIGPLAALTVKHLGWPGDRLPLSYGPWLDVLWLALIACGPVAFGQLVTSSNWRMAWRILGAVTAVHLTAAVLIPSSWVGSWYWPVGVAGILVDVLLLDSVMLMPLLFLAVRGKA